MDSPLEEIDERGQGIYKELEDAVEELKAVANTQPPGP